MKWFSVEKQTSAYARSLIEASLDPLVTISPEGKITDVNEATVKVTGIPRTGLIGTDFSNYFTEPEKAREGYRQVFEKGFVTDYPLTIRHISGMLTDVLYNASVYRDAEGRVLGVFAAARDITAQKQASQYARSLIEASLDPLVTISPEGKITDVNEATVKVTGVPRDGLVGIDFSNSFTEPDKARDGYRKVFEQGFVTDYPLTIRHKDGKLVDVLYNASVYKDVRGSVLGVFAAARDVTESRRVLREFSETKNFLDNILQSSTKYSIIGKDLKHHILSWNEGARRNYGYAAEEIIGKDSGILHTPEDIKSGVVDRMLAIAQEKGVAEGEFMRVRKDSSRFMASVVVTRRDNASGTPIGFLLMSNDITEKQRAEEQLRYASEYARSLIEASLDPLVTISPQGKITDVNEATIKVTGVHREGLIGTDFSNYFTEPEKAREGYRQVFEKGFVTDYPLTIRHRDGKLVVVLYNASVYKDPEGNVMGVFAAARDVTEQKQASQYARSLIEASLDPLVTISPQGKITDVNEATIKVTGVTREGLIGTDFTNYFTEPGKAGEGYRQVFEKGFVTDYPLTIRQVSGRLTDVLYNASVYRDVEGKVLGVFAAARDTTAQKQASQYARSLIEASLDPLVTISPEGKITDVNEATVKVTGVTRTGLIGTDFSNYFTEPEKAREGYRQAFEKGFVTDYPLTIRQVSGRLTDVLYNASVYRDVEGKVLGVFAAARDTTAQKQASQYARSLIEASLDPLVTISPEGKITDVNEATVKVTGVSRTGLIGTDFSNYFTEPEKAREGYRQAFEKGFVTDYPLTIRQVSGRLTDVLYNASVYKDVEGKVLGVFAAARDTTAQKKMEQELKELNATLEQRINERTENLSNQNREIIKAANLIAGAATEILTATTQVASGAAESAASINETMTTVEEVKQTAVLATDKSRNVSESAQNAALIAEQGNAAVIETMEGIERIKELMTTVAESVVMLSEQTQAIGEIITVVGDLAQQSNLLAVNAAIEASKAGEQGKGFTVVAQEIKSLADQSKQATEQVRKILADIQRATGKSVLAAEQVSKAVEGGVQQAAESGESIKKLAETIGSAAQAAAQIAASSQQQLAGMEQVALSMESIKQAAQQNVSGTKQSEQAAHNLNELGQKLKEMVEKYKV